MGNSLDPSIPFPRESEQLQFNPDGIPTGTIIEEAIYNGRLEVLGPTIVREAFNKTVNSAAEFIEKSGSVTLVIPATGGIPLADAVIRNLRKRNYDLSQIDIRLAAKVVKGVSAEGKKDIHYILSDEDKKVRPTVVMIDDIVDTVEAYREIRKKVGELTCFTPIIKDEAKDEAKEGPSTLQIAEALNFSIRNLDNGNAPVNINFALLGKNIWINDAFGMDSGHATTLLKKLDTPVGIDELKELFSKVRGEELMLKGQLFSFIAEIEALERISGVCLAEKPQDMFEYVSFLRGNVLHGTDMEPYSVYELLRSVKYMDLFYQSDDPFTRELAKFQLILGHFSNLMN